MQHTLDRRIAEIAVRQHGLITRAQVLEAGMQPDRLRWRVRRRQLEPVQRGVYQVGLLAAPFAREMAAVLACGAGAVISHRSAAALWRIAPGGDESARHGNGASARPGSGSSRGPSRRAKPGSGAVPRRQAAAHGATAVVAAPAATAAASAAPAVAAAAFAAPTVVATHIDVTLVRADRGHRPGVRAHRVRRLPRDEATQLDGIPITTLARTIVDVASEASSGELTRMLALAIREHNLDTAALTKLMARYPHRPGVPLLRALLADDSAPALTRSQAEEELLALIRKGQLPAPEVNAHLERYEVDMLWQRERLVIEVDGFAYHASRARFENDRRRDASLAARGFRVMRVTWRQIRDEPEATLVRLAQALLAPASPAER